MQVPSSTTAGPAGTTGGAAGGAVVVPGSPAGPPPESGASDVAVGAADPEADAEPVGAGSTAGDVGVDLAPDVVAVSPDWLQE
ncbi:hypothetical protein HDA35_001513 [Micromonospora purpureochromogenes]|uniref:Uncharacterized protein n=1 Tax=Micromonospora purpureochromogenes TaxID=47872 RepID=A0ABX2RGQ0_9ACTN|nr:hypothetical protein [Micromonospora purpureochromogenes]